MSRRALSEYHRDDRDYIWIDMRGRLGDGVALTSATVEVSQASVAGGWTDVTASFGNPTATVNPTGTTDEAGNPVGGAGWIRVGLLAPGDVDPGQYVLKVESTLSDARKRTETLYIPVTDRGDEDAV